ncbi:MAG: hypothetical protein Fur0042_15960 [Cyanophyceae cyanobacterium]
MVFGPVNLLPNAIADLFVESIASHQLTALDRHVLRTAILDGGLDDDEISAIDRLLYSVRRGRIQWNSQD